MRQVRRTMIGRGNSDVPLDNFMKHCSCNIHQNFLVVKMKIFTRKKIDIFLIFAQNIDFGYRLEPPRRSMF